MENYYLNQISKVLKSDSQDQEYYPKVQLFGTEFKTKHIDLTNDAIDTLIGHLTEFKNSKAQKQRESK